MFTAENAESAEVTEDKDGFRRVVRKRRA